jgi:hypothetical protein
MCSFILTDRQQKNVLSGSKPLYPAPDGRGEEAWPLATRQKEAIGEVFANLQ